MTITVRLDRNAERLLGRLARERGRSKSAIVRESIVAMADAKHPGVKKASTVYQAMKPYLGVINAGGSLLAGELRAKYAAHLRKKHFGQNPR